MKLKIEDIARITGYAKSTVSAALNDKPGVGVDAKERIRLAAVQLNYIPNEYARSLSTKSTSTIGVIVRDISNPFYAKMCRAVENVAAKHGYSILICNTDGQESKAMNAIRLMESKMITGLVVDISGNELELLMELHKMSIPAVVFGAGNLNIDFDSVEADDGTGAYQAVEHLIACGHTKIGFVHGGSESVYSQRRLSGLKDAFLKHHIAFHENYILHDAKTVENGCEIGRRLLTMQDRPTALLVYNDLAAIGIVRSLGEQGHTVPDFISIISFDNIELATFPLTTVDIPEYAMGERAAELLVRRIQQPDGPKEKVTLPTQLVVRKSVKSV